MEAIVSSTELFVFILSEGYFQSEFCMKELAATIKFKIPIVIILDCLYEIPEKFQSTWDFLPSETIGQVVSSSSKYVWMAEYHNSCVDKIVNFHAGASDSTLSTINTFIPRFPLLKLGFDRKEFNEECILDLTLWPEPSTVEDFLLGFV